ncbi:MAG: MarR family transcriptional regulator [Myxococcota bacterium]|nr:MarR family transcriptional regulator [Myxococcota bacterium]
MPGPKHELDAPPWQRVESTLMATARAIRDVYDASFAALDLNLTQASLLVFVQESGPLRQTQLARRLGLGRAATGTTVDLLERRGLVERQADPQDRRAWLVTITPAGKDLVEPINAIDREVRAELRHDISRAERQQLAKLLLRLQENVARVLAGSDEG